MIAEDKFYGRRKDGSEFPIEILLNPISTVAGNFIMVTVINLSERSRAERTIAQAAAALRASEEQRHLAVEAAEIGVWTWDFSTNTLAWSERMREIIGASPDTEPTHENYFDRIHPQDRRIVEENTDRARLSLQNFESEYRIIRADDRLLRWVSSTGRIRYDTSGNPIGMHGVIQDITRRKEAELERNDLLRRLMEAQEQERLRLAQDLHDQTGQSVTAVLLQIKHIEAQITGPAHCELEALRNQLERMGKSLHRIAWELRPASIDELGLVSSLTNYIDEWSALTKIDAVLYGSDASTQDLPKDVNAAIYRILQEALTNISKHAASATTVSVVVDRRGDTLRLTVSDNGPGFDSSAHFSGLGLAGMRERLAVIGGELEIESVVGIGTTIIARIPLAGPV